MLNREIDTCAGSDGAGRKFWSAPRVIVSPIRNAEAKVNGAATPDSHFGSIDYGDIPS